MKISMYAKNNTNGVLDKVKFLLKLLSVNTLLLSNYFICALNYKFGINLFSKYFLTKVRPNINVLV